MSASRGRSPARQPARQLAWRAAAELNQQRFGAGQAGRHLVGELRQQRDIQGTDRMLPGSDHHGHPPVSIGTSV